MKSQQAKRAAADIAAVRTDAHIGTLNVLTDLAELQRLLDSHIRSEVEHARSIGHSWSKIGTSLGTTKQGAQQRYGRS